MQKNTFRIDNLTFDIRLNSNPNPMPLVCFFHGYKSYRNWGFIPYVCEQFAENGFISLNLDFSKNGVIDELNYKFDPEIFAQNTVSQELADANHLLDILTDNTDSDLREFISEFWNKEIYFVGHSRGGAIALLTARDSNMVKKVALWSTVSHLMRHSDRYKENLKRAGSLDFYDTLAHQELRVNYSSIEDLEINKNKFDLLKAISQIRQPIIILCGENDMIAPANESFELFNNAKSSQNAQIVKIPKANHIYNVKYPFKSITPELSLAINTTINFFSQK